MKVKVINAILNFLFDFKIKIRTDIVLLLLKIKELIIYNFQYKWSNISMGVATNFRLYLHVLESYSVVLV